MQQHRQIVAGRQRVNPHQCRMVGSGRFALGQRCQLIMAGENFPDAEPHPRIPPYQRLNLVSSVHVRGINTADKGFQPPLLRLRQRLDRLCHNVIGGAVVIQRRLITQVIAWFSRCLRLPLLHHRQAEQPGRFHPGLIHCRQHGLTALTVLHEIHVMQVRIRQRPRLNPCTAQ